jgi:hypothetical protein
MKHRRLFAIAVVAVLAALVFALLEMREQPTITEASTVPPAHSLAAPTPSSVARLKAPREPKPAARPAPAADEIEVCGYGNWKLDAQGVPVDLDTLDARHSAAFDTARHALGVALAASDDEVTRAVGLWTQSLEVPLRELPVCEDDACLKPYLDAWNKRLQANDAPRAALVRMAQTTTAPQVYALAYSACQANRLDFGATCGLINIEQWARLDPGNALPWFKLADERKAQGDLAGVDEAFFRASHAKTATGIEDLVRRAALSHMAPDTPPLAQGDLVMDLFNSALGGRLTASPSRYCEDAALQDGNRRQTCARLGEMLATRSDSLLDLHIGIAISERAGLPPERVAAWQEESDAMKLQSIEGPFKTKDDPRQALGCEGVTATLRLHRELSREGEVHALRSAVERSGHDRAELARRYRETMRQMSEAMAASFAASAGR